VISSRDAIVYRILGNLNRAEAGLSLEEILQRIGLGRGDLARQYKEEFREAHTRTGQQDAIQGRGCRHGN
jgi:AraC-like DNA-binding protein